jgi:hypothetical protein
MTNEQKEDRLYDNEPGRRDMNLPEAGFLRVWQIVGDVKRGVPPLIPISKSAWWLGVKSGRYPASIKLSERTTVWRVDDIRKLILDYG